MNVADDDAMFRKILQSWLQNWAYEVIIAEDGGKAWEIIQEEQPPELLIFDWVMPGIDGPEGPGEIPPLAPGRR